MTIKF